MEIFTHVMMFLAALVGIVMIAVCAENLYWSSRDSSKVYGLKETLVNFSLGASYKLVDAAAIAIMFTSYMTLSSLMVYKFK